MDVQDAHGLDVDQGAHLAEAVAAAHLHVEALLLLVVVLQADINRQTALFALSLDILIDLHGAAGDAAGTGADQHRGHLLALLQSVFGICLEHMEGIPGHFRLLH